MNKLILLGAVLLVSTVSALTNVTWDNDAQGILGPEGIVAFKGNVYLNSFMGLGLQKVNPDGAAATLIGSGSQGGFGTRYSAATGKVFYATSNIFGLNATIAKNGVAMYQYSPLGAADTPEVTACPGAVFPNDLVIHSSGNVFVTDTGTGSIYKLPEAGGACELFMTNTEIGASVGNPGAGQYSVNGIDEIDSNRIVAASIMDSTVFVININDKSVVALNKTDGAVDAACDGLRVVGKTLLCVPVFSDKLVVQEFNDDYTALTTTETYDAAARGCTGVTTFALVNGVVYLSCTGGTTCATGFACGPYGIQEVAFSTYVLPACTAVDCGSNGSCEDGACVCTGDYAGDFCEAKATTTLLDYDSHTQGVLGPEGIAAGPDGLVLASFMGAGLHSVNLETGALTQLAESGGFGIQGFGLKFDEDDGMYYYAVSVESPFQGVAQYDPVTENTGSIVCPGAQFPNDLIKLGSDWYVTDTHLGALFKMKISGGAWVCSLFLNHTQIGCSQGGGDNYSLNGIAPLDDTRIVVSSPMDSKAWVIDVATGASTGGWAIPNGAMGCDGMLETNVANFVMCKPVGGDTVQLWEFTSDFSSFALKESYTTSAECTGTTTLAATGQKVFVICGGGSQCGTGFMCGPYAIEEVPLDPSDISSAGSLSSSSLVVAFSAVLAMLLAKH